MNPYFYTLSLLHNTVEYKNNFYALLNILSLDNERHQIYVVVKDYNLPIKVINIFGEIDNDGFYTYIGELLDMKIFTDKLTLAKFSNQLITKDRNIILLSLEQKIK